MSKLGRRTINRSDGTTIYNASCCGANGLIAQSGKHKKRPADTDPTNHPVHHNNS